MKSIVTIFLFCLLSSGSLCAQKAPATPDQESKPMVRFYPNPAINFITFDIKESVERGTTILVYSFLGRQIAAIPVNSQRVTVNISEYYRGIYVFQLRSPSGKVLETNKFQVNR